ncbi:MAG: hypothetical protein ABIF82_08770 [Planctomycetota bacterium]
MRRQTTIVLLIALPMIFGCDTAPVEWPEEAPSGPIVLRSDLAKPGDRMLWRNTGKPFTGRAVEYYGHGFWVEAFRDGYPVDIMEPAERVPLFPEGEPYQKAVREYVRKNGPDHSTYLFFLAYGAQADVPMLLYGLRSMGEMKGRSMVCTRGHCVDALQSITGAKPGYNYSDWEKWWQQEYRTDPPQWKPEGK